MVFYQKSPWKYIMEINVQENTLGLVEKEPSQSFKICLSNYIHIF